MTDQPTLLSQAEVLADHMLAAARTALIESGDPTRHKGNSRTTAVLHLTTGAARSATTRTAYAMEGAAMTDTHELHIAHLLIAELAARLAEQEERR